MDSKPTTRAAEHKFMPATITAILLENMLGVQGAPRLGAVRQGKADVDREELEGWKHDRARREINRPGHDDVGRGFQQRIPAQMTHGPA
jgi:hypothetical protein